MLFLHNYDGLFKLFKYVYLISIGHNLRYYMNLSKCQILQKGMEWVQCLNYKVLSKKNNLN